MIEKYHPTWRGQLYTRFTTSYIYGIYLEFEEMESLRFCCHTKNHIVYRNSYMFDKANKGQSKISKYENIQKSKTSKSDFSKTLRGDKQDTISQERPLLSFKTRMKRFVARNSRG